MLEEKTSIIDLTEDLLLSLNDGIVCTDEDNDMEGASYRFHAIEETLCKPLPGMEIYAWMCDDINGRIVESYASAEEAETALICDVRDIEEAYGFDDAEIKDDGRLVELSDDAAYDTITWKRFYTKEA